MRERSSEIKMFENCCPRKLVRKTRPWEWRLYMLILSLTPGKLLPDIEDALGGKISLFWTVCQVRQLIAKLLWTYFEQKDQRFGWRWQGRVKSQQCSCWRSHPLVWQGCMIFLWVTWTLCSQFQPSCQYPTQKDWGERVSAARGSGVDH